MIMTRFLAVTGLAAAAVMGAGVSLAATHTGASSTSTTVHACVNNKTHQLYQRHGASCPRGYTALSWNITGPRGATGPRGPRGATGPAGPQGPAGTSFTPVTATASIEISNDPDSGYNPETLELTTGGIWALDNWDATITLVRHSAVELSNCSNAPAGNAACYYYTGSVGINGTFQTVPGATSPGIKDVPITGIVQGTMTASYNLEFYADSGSLSSSGVPATIDNLNNESFAGTSSAQMYASFFPAGTDIVSSSGPGLVNQPNWEFNYLATSENCTAPQVQETWSDSYNVPEADGGDITGVCTTPSS
jgi:hypothetical protein